MLPRGVTLGGKLRPAALFHVLGQGPHGLPCNFHAVAAINRGFRDIDSGEDFGTATFTLDPKGHRGLHGVFGTLKSTALDGLPDKILLLGGEFYLHGFNVAVLAQLSRESMFSMWVE
jgi:hypothetical protein